MFNFLRRECRALWSFERGIFSGAPSFYATILGFTAFALGIVDEYRAILLMFFTYGHLLTSMFYIDWKADKADKRRRQQLREEADRAAIRRAASRPRPPPPTIDG